jgi:hypothetical protein
MVSQLWPVYAVALAMGLYTLKTIIASYFWDYNATQTDLSDVIKNIKPTETPFMRSMKENKND